MKIFYKYLISLCLLVIFIFANSNAFSQAPGCPNIIASNDTTLDCVPCVDLSATVLHTGETTTYGVTSIPYAPPFPFSGGTQIPITSDDDWSDVINIPFNFCFYDNMYTQLIIGDNGVISFDLTDAGDFCPWKFSDPIPFDFGSMMNIFGAYHDTYLPAGGSMWYSLEGTSPCRMFVFKFDHVAQFSCNTIETTQQIILYETTNVIEVYIDYKPVCSWNDGNAVIGIQNMAQTTALAAPGRNTGVWTLNSEAWRFYPDGNPNYVINWYEGVNNIGQGNLINVCPTSTTTYTAEVIYTTCDGGIVSDTDNVIITVINSLIADAGQDQIICPGDSVIIGGNPTASNGTMPYSYSWSPTIGLSNPNVSNPIAFPINSTTYIVTITDAGGCTGTDAVTVTVNENPTPTITGSLTFCTGNSTTLDAGAGYSTYTWSPAGNTQTINVTTAGTYSVTVTDAIGCIGADTVTVTESANPIITATASPTVICSGDNSTLTATGATTYIWDNGLGAGASHVVNPTITTTYIVTGTSAEGCIGDADTTDITVHDTPYIQSIKENESCIDANDGSVCLLIAGGTLPYSVFWDNLVTTDTVFDNLLPGIYNIIVIDSNGCENTNNVIIDESTEDCYPPYIYIPNIFSPNGDGENDIFFVRGYGIESLTFIVFNRWGEKVFETEDKDKGWNGTYKGKKMDTAVFVYTVKVLMRNGQQIDKSGDITLVR